MGMLTVGEVMAEEDATELPGGLWAQGCWKRPGDLTGDPDTPKVGTEEAPLFLDAAQGRDSSSPLLSLR